MLAEELNTVDKEKQYDKLADWFREHINMDLIYKQIGDLKTNSRKDAKNVEENKKQEVRGRKQD